jgi:hypothetical protein
MTLPPIAMPGEARPQEPDMVLALEDIIFGRLVPGSRPVEDALIARFGGSRHYVRQAGPAGAPRPRGAGTQQGLHGALAHPGPGGADL